MGKLIPTLFALFMAVTGYSQSISYDYDAAGNRVKRYPQVEVNKVAPGFTTGTMVSPLSDEEIPVYSGEVAGLDIDVYPVPTTNYLYINFTGTTDRAASYQLIDQQGRIVKSGDNAIGKETMDLVKEARGFYTLKVVVGEEVSTWQIVKQ